MSVKMRESRWVLRGLNVDETGVRLCLYCGNLSQYSRQLAYRNVILKLFKILIEESLHLFPI